MGLFSKRSDKSKQIEKSNTEAANPQATTPPAPKNTDQPKGQLSDPSVTPSSAKPLPDNRGAEARFAVFGKMISVLGRQKPFADMKLGQISGAIGPAIDAGLFALADGHPKDHSGPSTPLAFVIWARVSEEVDKRLSENPQGQASLAPQEWTSGDIHWLMLSVGPQQIIAEMLKSISKKLPEGQSFKMRFTDKDGQQRVGFVKVEEKSTTESGIQSSSL